MSTPGRRMRTSQCLRFRSPVEKLRSAPRLSRNSLLHRPPTGGAISASSQSGLHATERVPAKERDGLEKQLQANPTARVRRRLRSLPLLGSATRHAPRGDFRVYSSSGEISLDIRPDELSASLNAASELCPAPARRTLTDTCRSATRSNTSFGSSGCTFRRCARRFFT